MNVTQERLILDGADAAMACHEAGVLPDMLGELAVRLELAGAGGLLAVLVNTDWSPVDSDKRDPDPKPKPPPPPPPPEK